MSINTTSLTYRCWALSQELRREADRWNADPYRRQELLQGAAALAWAGRDAIKNPECSTDALEANRELLHEALRDRLLPALDGTHPLEQEVVDAEFARLVDQLTAPAPRPSGTRRLWAAILGEWAE